MLSARVETKFILLPSIIGDEPGEMGDALEFLDFQVSEKVIDLYGGNGHMCAHFDNMQIKCFGFGGDGRLGTESSATFSAQQVASVPYVDLGTDLAVETVDLGEAYTCAILNTSRVKCWGLSNFGQTGYNSTATRGNTGGSMGDNLPFVDFDSTGTGVALIGAGFVHSCVVLFNDTVKCWGQDGGPLLGFTGIDDPGRFPSSMGDNLPAQDIGSGISMVSIGFAHTCFTLNEACVKCFGVNLFGQLGVENTSPLLSGPPLDCIDLGFTAAPTIAPSTSPTILPSAAPTTLAPTGAPTPTGDNIVVPAIIGAVGAAACLGLPRRITTGLYERIVRLRNGNCRTGCVGESLDIRMYVSASVKDSIHSWINSRSLPTD